MGWTVVALTVIELTVIEGITEFVNTLECFFVLLMPYIVICPQRFPSQSSTSALAVIYYF